MTVYIQVAINTPLRNSFDYLIPKDCPENLIQIGSRVKVNFGKRDVIGVVLNKTNTTNIPKENLKNIIELIDLNPLIDQNFLFFLKKTSEYYHHPIGEVIFASMPDKLKTGLKLEDIKVFNNINKNNINYTQKSEPNFELTTEQQDAINLINLAQNNFKAFLLDGVTGSGKTEVYIKAIFNILSNNKQALVLVPEIALTPQTVNRFKERFGDLVACFHSKMTPKERLETWLKAKLNIAKIVIGTRSAIFLPFCNLGLIIVDEEHDASFKQQTGFKYSGRDLAVLRSNLVNCPVILGSATPSFESIYNTKINKYTLIKLPNRATQYSPPKINIVDIRHNRLRGALSAYTLDIIKKNLEANAVVLIFLNRRGFSPAWMCYECGYFAECVSCDARLTYHNTNNKLICHHCDKKQNIKNACPDCKSTQMGPLGAGTQRLEEVLKEEFPNVDLIRIDSDTTKHKGSLQELLSNVSTDKAQILIGTQLLAKGHHFTNLRLVVIVDADGGLFSTDFRAIEHMGQQIIQVAGRSGRGDKAGTVLMQTFHPENEALRLLADLDYHGFAENIMIERKACRLPPYSYLTMYRARSKNAKLSLDFLNKIKLFLTSELPSPELTILGPIPSPMERKAGEYRYQLLINSSNRPKLHFAMNNISNFLQTEPLRYKVRWSLDVDPIEMI